MSNFSIDHFQSLIKSITGSIGQSPLNKALEDRLNKKFNSNSDIIQAIEAACHAGIKSGALCPFEAGGIKYGRAIKPCPDLKNYSVDVVHMKDVKGPHHRHPQGEIDLIMPISAHVKFDGRSAGWLVYSPDSAHSPTITEGEALVLYLLPNGEIEFTSP